MISTCSLVLLMLIAACSDTSTEHGPENPPQEISLSEQNLRRAMELTDKAIYWFSAPYVSLTKKW